MNKQSRIESFKRFMGYILKEHELALLIDDLDKIEFFDKPASINHHGKETGDLFQHSFTVAECLVHLTEALKLKWKRRESPYLVGMFHDLCKCDLYERSEDSPTGWRYNENLLIPGHGEKSVIIAQQYFFLTDEEVMCIRWHMGAFDDKENWKYYSRAIHEYPNVLYTHTADMMASQIQNI